tara:strand:+ start:1737 stop:1955 length:219 start_codon:yes stop_codon:yes gene_type:complete
MNEKEEKRPTKKKSLDCDHGRYTPKENICIVGRSKDMGDEKSCIKTSREKNRSAHFWLHSPHYKAEVQETHY